MKAFVHGIQIDGLGTTEEIKTTFDIISASEEEIQPVKTNIPNLPAMEIWVNLKCLGA